MENSRKSNVMENHRKYWTDDEDSQLKKLYQHMDINEIANIHKRSSYAIACRLLKIKVVNNIEDLKGYNHNWINPTWDNLLNNIIEKIPDKNDHLIDNIKYENHTIASKPFNLHSNTNYVQHQIFELCAIIDTLKKEIDDLKKKNSLDDID